MNRLIVLLTSLAAIAMSSCAGADREANVTGSASSSPSTTPGPVVTESVARPDVDRPVESTIAPAGSPVPSSTAAPQPTSSPASLPPATTPRPADDQAALIWNYLRSGFAEAPWLGAIRQISVRSGEAFLTTEITPDGRGETLAGLACRAVLGNDRVPLSRVVVGGVGSTTAATCQR